MFQRWVPAQKPTETPAFQTCLVDADGVFELRCLDLSNLLFALFNRVLIW